MKNDELDLFIDLLQLRKKYGPETFESLAETISTTNFIKELSTILVNSSKTKLDHSSKAISPKLMKNKNYLVSKKTPVPRSLVKLKKKNGEKYKILSRLHRDLSEKTILPSLRDIKEFSADTGLSEINSKSRKQATSTLINSLAELQLEILKEKVRTLKKYDKENSSLEAWSKIILDREK